MLDYSSDQLVFCGSIQPSRFCYKILGSSPHLVYDLDMAKTKKLKNEAELIREVVKFGSAYVVSRGAGVIEESDSQKQKLEFIYRLLVHDKQIQPLPHDKLTDLNIKHRLAMWLTSKLPKNHPLLQ